MLLMPTSARLLTQCPSISLYPSLDITVCMDGQVGGENTSWMSELGE